MKDFVVFDKALKLNWVNRLQTTTLHEDILQPLFLLMSVTPFLCQCNCDCRLFCLSDHLPRFQYKDVITYWQKIVATCPKNKPEVLNQVIWTCAIGFK